MRSLTPSMAMVILMLGADGLRAENPTLTITVEKGGSATRGSGIGMYRERPTVPAGTTLAFLGKYDSATNVIRFLDPPWIHVTWPRQEHWRLYFSVKTGERMSRTVSQYLEPVESEALQKVPAVARYVEQVKASGTRRVPHVRLSLHDAYAGSVPAEFAGLDAEETMVGVFCDNLGDTRPAVQQAFVVRPDKPPPALLPGRVAVFTGEIRPNRPDVSYRQKQDKKLHHFNLTLGETRPIAVNLDEAAGQRVFRELITREEQRLTDICTAEKLSFRFDPAKPLRTTWIDERMVVSGGITPRPTYSRKPVPYATASVFFDPETGKPQRITVALRTHQDPWD